MRPSVLVIGDVQPADLMGPLAGDVLCKDERNVLYLWPFGMGVQKCNYLLLLDQRKKTCVSVQHGVDHVRQGRSWLSHRMTHHVTCHMTHHVTCCVARHQLTQRMTTMACVRFRYDYRNVVTCSFG
jgi:hypothetical protein